MRRRQQVIKSLGTGILTAALVLSSVSPAYVQAEENTESQQPAEAGYVEGEVVVLYQADVSEDEITESVAEQGGESAEVLAQSEDQTVVLADVPEGMSAEEAAEQYEEDDRVVAASPNYELELFADENPVNDTDYSSQTYIWQTYTEQAWDLLEDVSHSKVRVAVLDTGADLDHEDLVNVINTSLSCEILDSSGTTGTLFGDGYINGVLSAKASGHGTHVSGIIAAEANNGTGIAGVASAEDNSVVELMEVDVFSGDTTTTLGYLLQGMEYARNNGAKIINMSLGMKSTSVDISVLEAECKSLEEDGIILICAAGNYGTGDNGSITVVPSDYDSTISVIAVNDSNDRVASSSYGTRKNISAPGLNILSTTMDGSYGTLSGTSMAAPVVTAVVAMMCSIDPSLTTDEVQEILQSEAIDLGSSGFDAQTAYGLVNARRSVETVAEEAGVLPDVDLPFTDIADGAWPYDEVSYVYRYGIMAGLETGVLFGPAETVSRAQFATILYRYAGSEEVTSSSPYTDVAEDLFYTDAAAWAKEKGVITGYENGLFGPTDDITREQMAVILYRYAQVQNAAVSADGDLDSFPDGGSVSSFATEAMKWAVGTGIIRGTGDGYLAPQESADRAECATMIQRYMDIY